MWYGIYNVLPTDKTKKQLAKHQNNLEFQNVFMTLSNMCLNIFEWKGLPDTCDPRLMEFALLYRGFMAFYRDNAGNIWSYSAGPGGELTKYGYPNKGYLYALNGTVEQCQFYWPFMDNTNANGVLCLDSKLHYPFINYIVRGAERVSDAKRAIDVALQNAKRPYIFSGTEEQCATIKSIYNDIANNEPYIIVDDSTINTVKPTSLNTYPNATPIKDLWDVYKNVYADVLETMGIQVNDQSDKKERMTIQEVSGNLSLVKRTQDFRLEERQAFCERVNEAFGLNVSVDYKNDILENINELSGNIEGGQLDAKQNIKSDNN